MSPKCHTLKENNKEIIQHESSKRSDKVVQGKSFCKSSTTRIKWGDRKASCTTLLGIKKKKKTKDSREEQKEKKKKNRGDGGAEETNNEAWRT